MKGRDFGRIGILAGGPSNEREISLRSGDAVYRALVEEGIDAGNPYGLVGGEALIIFDNVFVPDENFLGEEVGKGVHYAGEILNEVRIMTAMCALAIAKGAMEDAREYAKNRIAFGNLSANTN
jgi:alkylation response protein AidB-like acyl-CoA dehydrogenase